MFDGFGVMEGIVFGVLGLLTGLCGFVVMARRAGIIPDPKEQAQLLVNLQKALNDSASTCLLYTSPSPRDRQKSRMPSSA